MTNKHVAIIALGSNLANPIQHIQAALAAIAHIPHTQILRTSSLYQTAPVGYAHQPDFINAVCMVETELTGLNLLQTLQQIEQQFGRERTFRNAPRTLDLDIIDYAHQISDDATLTLPHPRAHERSFVMRPLAEIAPDYPIGQHGSATDLAAQLGNEGITPCQLP